MLLQVLSWTYAQFQHIWRYKDYMEVYNKNETRNIIWVREEIGKEDSVDSNRQIMDIEDEYVLRFHRKLDNLTTYH